jgi:hypothetical protein
MPMIQNSMDAAKFVTLAIRRVAAVIGEVRFEPNLG